jgi:hypothetical protein
MDKMRFERLELPPTADTVGGLSPRRGGVEIQESHDTCMPPGLLNNVLYKSVSFIDSINKPSIIHVCRCNLTGG